MTPMLTSAPSNAVRRKARSRPPIISAVPVKMVYPEEAPMNVHRSPIGEGLPKGSISWLGKGWRTGTG